MDTQPIAKNKVINKSKGSFQEIKLIRARPLSKITDTNAQAVPRVNHKICCGNNFSLKNKNAKKYMQIGSSVPIVAMSNGGNLFKTKDCNSMGTKNPDPIAKKY